MRQSPRVCVHQVTAPVIRLVLATIVGCCVLTTSVSAESANCAACHKAETAAMEGSVHSALRCQECHGGPAKYELDAETLQRLAAPDATSLARGQFDHGATFTGKAARADVPDLCGNCHADVERMNAYGIRTDQLARYWTSGHGKSLKENNESRVAVCTDCHGNHDILIGSDPESKTHPTNIPATCATCHADAELMAEFDLAVEIHDEYRDSVHGRLLFEQGDTGAPTCATCHGNHSAMPPGFATVGAVCGQCHQAASKNFETSIHATLEEHKGCVQCHGGGEGRHFHYIERITKPSGVLIQRYAHLLETVPSPTPEQIAEALHPDPKQIITHALPTCLDCHEELEDDESLPKLFGLIDAIREAEQSYVETANRLNELGQGVLLVEAQRFKFQDAKTHLIELAPLQHTLDNELVAEKVTELNTVCDEVMAELDTLERGLRIRHLALIPVWLFAIFFSAALYVKFKRLKRAYVKPLPNDWYK